MIGGNSLKASSGINGCSTSTQKIAGVRDSVPLFVNDTVKSSGPLGNRKLQNLLVSESSGAIEWLKEEIGVKLDVVNQLGGHSTERTHRSDGIPPGFEIISKLKEKVLKHDKLFSLKLNARLVGIDVKNDSVKGVTYRDESTQKDEYVESSNVILATGGFGFSRELIKKFKPEYADLPTTNGAQTLGEGQLLIESIGGELIDMDQIQIHPTGFIKQDDRDSRWKFLAAESLRGIGVVLFTVDKLERFVNKRDTRDTSKK
jgi:FAD-dependent fumarate reductase